MINDNNADLVGPTATDMTVQDAAAWTVAGLYAILAYNLGVIYHENGLARGVRQDLGQARAWYQKALLVMRQHSNNSQPQPQQQQWMVPDRIYLGLYTNLGHVAAFLEDDWSMRICSKGIETHLTNVMNGTERGGSTRNTPLQQHGGRIQQPQPQQQQSSCNIKDCQDDEDDDPWMRLLMNHQQTRLVFCLDRFAPAA